VGNDEGGEARPSKPGRHVALLNVPAGREVEDQVTPEERAAIAYRVLTFGTELQQPKALLAALDEAEAQVAVLREACEEELWKLGSDGQTRITIEEAVVAIGYPFDTPSHLAATAATHDARIRAERDAEIAAKVRALFVGPGEHPSSERLAHDQALMLVLAIVKPKEPGA
jgi:hypothetical protein